MKRGVLLSLFWVLCFAALGLAAEGAPTAKLEGGDTAWVLISSALVALMTVPGLALFYGGLTKQKATLNTIFMSFLAFAVVSILWNLYGYTLAFKGDWKGLVGTFELIFAYPSLEALNNTIPEILFSFFQLTFGAITVALISGALIERMNFTGWLLFSVLWFSLVYVPVAHWVWGGGFLGKWGALDFAGGTVVHINAGIAALLGALFLKPRKEPILKPHNLTLVALGTGLLWFGWFGFNGGSALSANALAAVALLNTNTATATAALSWMFVEWIWTKRPTLLGFCSGAVAGLVAITPAAGFVSPISSILIGFVAGIVPYFAVAKIKPALGYDDALDVFGIHGVAGILGALLTGVFADPAINSAGKGLIAGNAYQVWIQFLSIIVVILYNLVITSLIFLVLKVLGILKVSEEVEVSGLDLALHGEKPYEID